MRALIFNSGLGSRLGTLTADRPKCLVELGSGETIFHRQLRILHACGICDFVVTTGPFPHMVKAVAGEFEKLGCTFSFVQNDDYDRTNYIYSMWLARHELAQGDFLMLHGDLVFDAAYVQDVLDSAEASLGSVNPHIPQPPKDFKARVIDGEVREVSVGIFDSDCIAFQPLYKLSHSAMSTWLQEVERFVGKGDTAVYAENAANQVFAHMHVAAHSYHGHFVEEVDTPEDLRRVSAEVRLYDFANQPVFRLSERGTLSLEEGSAVGQMREACTLAELMAALGMRRPLVVTEPFFATDVLNKLLEGSDANVTTFCAFAPNPTLPQVLAGVQTFVNEQCDSVLSLGGGSSIDVAKCIKAYAGTEGATGEQADVSRVRFSSIVHLAIPTTAGTGSESTHFAVVYVDGSKQSVAHDCLQPNVAVLAPQLLAGLPAYHKRATLLDALCQAIESYWSVASCEQSREYSSRAIPLILGNADAYLEGDPVAATAMATAANLAGKAINLTTTTLPHAMSYKLTSLYGIAHGHAVALCMSFAWRTLAQQGNDVCQQRLREIDALMALGNEVRDGCGLARFEALFSNMGLELPKASTGDIAVLAQSVNPQRMGNFPVKVTLKELEEAYRTILKLS